MSGDPFLVSTQAQLAAIDDAAECRSAFYKQSAEIALVGQWTPLGVAYSQTFTGNYNGDWKTISALRVGTAEAPLNLNSPIVDVIAVS